VELREYKPGLDVIDEVMSRQANYGINNSSIVIVDGRIVSTVLLATYLQQSPLVFVTSFDIKNPKDFIGRRLMGTADELKYSSLALLMDHFDINRDNTEMVEHTFNIDDFVEHRVDIMSAFRSNQLYELDKRGIKYNIFNPADYGFYMSAVNVFSSRDEVLGFSERTQKFIDASNRGWAYALDHTDELIDLIYDKYSQRKSKVALAYEANITREMMLLDFFPIGQANKDLTLRALKQLKQNKRLNADEFLGTFLFKDLVQKHSDTIEWTARERNYMEEKQKITMCVDPEWLPLEAIREGNHIGIAADVFDLFQKRLPIPITLVNTQTWVESLEKAKARECDIFSLASETPDRKHYMDFTSSYLDLPIVMVTRMDKPFIETIEQVKKEKIGIVSGYAFAESLRNKIKGIHIVEVASLHEGLKQVENGNLYGYIDNLMVISPLIQKQFTGLLKISARLDEDLKLAVGTRNDEPVLQDIFEKLVSHIKEKELQGIYNNWISVEYQKGFDYRLFWEIMIGVFAVAAMSLFYSYKLQKHNKKLREISVTDPLTRLYNRFKINKILALQYASLLRYGNDCGIIFLDIDYFKKVNDMHGHTVGDDILVEFSNVLKNNVREMDAVGRWGGEEFLIVCPNIGIISTEKMTQKLLQKICTHSFSHGLTLSASFGVGSLRQELSVVENIEHVDKALYQAKSLGRGRIEIADHFSLADAG
ncbi:MAG: diguanylate cyclase, partial [Deltaproteobacteria bacterium]|nr:diguanylate cyclase [Deltaproteobacteria bacterium]